MVSFFCNYSQNILHFIAYNLRNKKSPQKFDKIKKRYIIYMSLFMKGKWWL